MTKPAVPPTAEEALRRVDEITIALLWEVRRLLETRAVMETANQVILEKGIILGAYATTHQIVQSRLAMALALDLARAFDQDQAGRSLDDQHKASIPILAHHLARSDVRQALQARAAASWSGVTGEPAEVFQQTLDRALESYAAFRADPLNVAALAKIRDLRTARLAHYLYDQEPSRPLYSDLFLLSDFAKTFVENVAFAVTAAVRDMANGEAEIAWAARTFWNASLHANIQPAAT
jgi:hypothetical protein